MYQANTIDNELMTKSHRKGNNSLTNELVQFLLNQYKKDNNKKELKMDLQKIALTCSRPALRN
jgi:FMN-dependent NADH-azoreductase